MSGVPYPAMSCGGRGNVGIAGSVPLVSLARDLKKDEEALIRAITMSYLVSLAIIHRISRYATMCECEVAATLGLAAGVILLKGGDEPMVEIAVQNTVPSVFGVVCDGAKLACALRISSGAGVAIEAANLTLTGVRLANNQGVLSTSADTSIDMLGRFALRDMTDSDRGLCKRMFEKRTIFPLKTFEERQRQ